MKLKQYIVTVLVTLSIIVLSTLPIPEDAPMSDVPLIDKWVHMVMYMGLVLAMWFDHVVRSEKKPKESIFCSCFCMPHYWGD